MDYNIDTDTVRKPGRRAQLSMYNNTEKVWLICLNECRRDLQTGSQQVQGDGSDTSKGGMLVIQGRWQDEREDLNIAIIVYSRTGNTHSVAQTLQEKLREQGHSCALHLLRTADSDDETDAELRADSLPGLDQYDALILGTPVHAFSLPRAVTAYLRQMPSLKDRKLACFATKQLPFHWTGGSQAIGRMKSICEKKGATVIGAEIVIWSGARRDDDISRCIDNLSRLFS